MAATGEHPQEIIQGLLCPLQNPGKAMGPVHNLRPILLLSMLRKILAICLMKRTNSRIDNQLPPTQAAYRKGRSTTEHVFATKLVIERTITSKNKTVFLTMHDMSKAFDSINRTVLLNNLKTVINNDEVHTWNMLLL
jgi:hypothetical protein